jgi:hypothetical protein
LTEQQVQADLLPRSCNKSVALVRDGQNGVHYPAHPHGTVAVQEVLGLDTTPKPCSSVVAALNM